MPVTTSLARLKLQLNNPDLDLTACRLQLIVEGSNRAVQRLAHPGKHRPEVLSPQAGLLAGDCPTPADLPVKSSGGFPGCAELSAGAHWLCCFTQHAHPQQCWPQQVQHMNNSVIKRAHSGSNSLPCTEKTIQCISIHSYLLASKSQQQLSQGTLAGWN